MDKNIINSARQHNVHSLDLTPHGMGFSRKPPVEDIGYPGEVSIKKHPGG